MNPKRASGKILSPIMAAAITDAARPIPIGMKNLPLNAPERDIAELNLEQRI